MLQCIVEKDGVKLFNQLKGPLPYFSFSAFQKAVSAQKVFVNGQACTKDRGLNKGDVVELRLSDPALARYRTPVVEVVYEDDNIAAVLKASGVEVESGGQQPSLTSWTRVQLARNIGAAFPAPCHKLDMQTSGIVIFAKTPAVQSEMAEAFKQKRVQKLYACLVRGVPMPRLAEISTHLVKDSRSASVRVCPQSVKGAFEAVTRYRIAQTFGRFSVLEVNPVTARPHQIRAHLAYIGHPIIGDEKYGDHTLNKRLNLSKHQLTCCQIAFDLPRKSPLSYLNDKDIVIPTPDFNIRKLKL